MLVGRRPEVDGVRRAREAAARAQDAELAEVRAPARPARTARRRRARLAARSERHRTCTAHSRGTLPALGAGPGSGSGAAEARSCRRAVREARRRLRGGALPGVSLVLQLLP